MNHRVEDYVYYNILNQATFINALVYNVVFEHINFSTRHELFSIFNNTMRELTLGVRQYLTDELDRCNR